MTQYRRNISPTRPAATAITVITLTTAWASIQYMNVNANKQGWLHEWDNHKIT